MAFDVHPDDSAPLAVPAGATRTVPLRARSGPDNSMWIRLVALPAGAAVPEFSLQVDGGPQVVVPQQPATVTVRNGVNATVGTALCRVEDDGVHRLRVLLTSPVTPAQSWTFGIRNTDPSDREFVWVVADTLDEAAQPWLSMPVEVAVSTETDRPTPASATFDVRNLGTGPLRVTGPQGDLGGGVTVTLPTGDVPPAGTGQGTVRLDAPPAATTVTVVREFTGNDPRAGTAARHNARVTFVGTVREPLWLPGDVLVADIRASDGNPDTAGGIVRVRPGTGRQALVATGGLLVSPADVAVGPDGHALVADPSGGADGSGALLRVDRVTGEQSVVSSGGTFRDPVSVVVAPGGRIVVADASASGGVGALIAVDGATGAQTTVASGDPLRRPIDLAATADGSLVALTTEAAGGTVVRVDPGGRVDVLVPPTPGRVASGIATDGDRVLVVGAGADESPVLTVVEPDGTTTDLSTGGMLGAPTRLTTTGDGRVLVTDWNVLGQDEAGLVGVDPPGGDQSTLSLRGLLVKPRGVVVVPPQGS